MKVLLTAVSWPTSYFHLVPLGWALRAAGHDVRVVGHPDITEAITGSGLTAAPVGGAYGYLAGLAEARRAVERTLGRPPRPEDGLTLPPDTRRRLLELRLEPHVAATEAMADEMVELAEDWGPDLVVALPTALAAPLVAHRLGIPLVRHLWGPDPTRLAGFPGAGMDPERWPERLRALYDRMGTPVAADYGELTLDPTPDAMQIAGVPNRIGVRYVPYNGPGVVPRWLLEKPGRRRVVVSWSTMNTLLDDGAGFAGRTIMDALAGLDLDVVLTLPRDVDAASVGELPPGVRLAQVAHLLVMPTCDAVIHHGGTGTMLNAAVHGVPQVIVAGELDQMFTAQQLAETGAGFGFRTDDVDPAELRAAVHDAIAVPAVRKAASGLRDEMLAAPAPADIVCRIAGLAA
jgi:UDP:flavonoid glycosyltransferase YjiC (YdhE family)